LRVSEVVGRNYKSRQQEQSQFTNSPVEFPDFLPL
jgi:hypothetical protein